MTGDRQTLQAYGAAAAGYAAEWEDGQNTPEDLYELLRTFFVVGTAIDVGCGSGRDTAWLADNGFDVRGLDASEALLAEARIRHPGLRFDVSTLPHLTELGAGRARNVLCETVIMHLPHSEIGPAVKRLWSLVEPAGTLYLSWRVTTNDGVRDPAGRLYSAFEAELVRRELPGGVVLHDVVTLSQSSGRTIHRLIVQRPS